MQKLSIVIVNYNGKDFLRHCLTSLYGSKDLFHFETIVVDNGSQDGSPKMVKDEFPQVRLIQNLENLGFARANNIGIGAARGEYILLLNSDTTILGDALRELVSFLAAHRDVGVVTGRLVYPDFQDQGVARSFPTPMNALFGRRSILTRIFPNNKISKRYLMSRIHRSDDPFEVDWVSGACLMVKKGVLEEVGYLDERFWMYWEDADLCYRIKQKGWKIYCVPKAVVIHHEGKSTSKRASRRCIIEFNRNAYRYYRKHHIRSPFELKNVAALIGLLIRTFVLLGINVMKKG